MFKVLVVEDNNATADLIRHVLTDQQLEIQHVADGSLALEAVHRIMPDLILLDVMLPEIDGYSIQHKLLEEEKTRRIPILMMTTKYQMEESFQASTNVAGFLPKPFEIKELVRKVKEILSL